LRLVEFQRMNEVNSGIVWVIGVWLRVTLVMTGVAVLLSLTAIFAVLSFTVSRRTREIGVRVALGAGPLRIVAAIFRRPLFQVGFGILVGTVMIATVAHLAKWTDFPGSEGGLSLTALGLVLANA